MDTQAHEDRRRETEAAHPIVDESIDGGPFRIKAGEKLPLIGRDRVLAEKLAKELRSSTNHNTRGPYETPRGAKYDVQFTDENDKPTGHIFQVSIELVGREEDEPS